MGLGRDRWSLWRMHSLDACASHYGRDHVRSMDNLHRRMMKFWNDKVLGRLEMRISRKLITPPQSVKLQKLRVVAQKP
jgi:hypothetical protein